MKKHSVSLTIKGAPVSINKLYYNAGRRARILSWEGKQFKENLKWIAKSKFKHYKMTLNPVSVWVRYYFPTRAGDCDNCDKVLFDSFEGVLYKNDSQVADNTNPNFKDTFIVFEKHVQKHKDKDDPRTEIKFEWFEL